MKTGVRKKLLIGIIVSVAAVAGVWIILMAVRNGSRKPVRVYKVSDVAQTDYWADEQSSYGTVASDQIQNVFLTNTQSVSKVFVQKGQQVKAGDPLIAYDTTLSQINIEKAENDLNQQKRTLDLARKELAKMQKTKPVDERKVVTPSPVTEDGEEEQPETPDGDGDGETVPDEENRNGEEGNGSTTDIPDQKKEPTDTRNSIWAYHLDTNYQGESIGESRTYETPALLDGIGTVERPAIWIWSEDDDLSDALLKSFFEKTMDARKKAEKKETGTGSGEDVAGDPASGELPSDKKKDTEESDAAVSASGADKTEGQTALVGRAFRDSDHDVYLVLRQYMENNPAHKKIAEHGLHLEMKSGKLEVSLFNPDLLAVREAGTDSDAASVPEAVSGTTDQDMDSSDVSGFGEEGETTEDQNDPEETENGEGITGDETEAAGRSDMNDASGATGSSGGGNDSSGSSDSDTASDSSADYAAMTRRELNQAISDQKIKIRDQEIVEKLAEIKVRQMKHELSDGIVRSKITGVVKTVRDPETAYEKNKSCVTVSNGGGYQIKCAVSELSLSGIKKGMTASVTSTDTGDTEEGKVISISTEPSSGDSYGSSNNPNVSYYDCIVQLPESSEMKENDFVSVSFGGSDSSQKGLFLDSMFIRSDDGGSYVFLKGKNQKLKKQYIRTGRDIGGGTMEILSGLSIKDRIAFPYGSNVEDGAKTKNSDTDQLYS